MKPPRPKSIDVAANLLRSIVRAAEEGEFLGSEEDVVARLGVSRATTRQVARLLEREGLLRVKRGLNGGYFAIRPDVATIAETVSTYLETADTEQKDVTEIASLLWVEVVRKASALKSAEAGTLVASFRDRILSLKEDAPFEEVRKIEEQVRTAVFNLINSRYTELIFRINIVYAMRHFQPSVRDGTPEHCQFVRDWRQSKVIELEAIADGDQVLASMAARHCRNLWHQRLWGKMPD